MININELKINDVATEISVDVDTTVSNVFTQVLLWTTATFKDIPSAIDLSHLLAGTDETEVFTIPASELGVSKIEGLFWVEFTTDEPDTKLGVVSNFIPYYECLLNKTMASGINSCKTTNPEITYINVLIEVLNQTIQTGFYEEAVKISDELDKICAICATCPSYSDTLLVNGLGFGTIDNAITLI